MALGDLQNDYQKALGEEPFRKTPKTVFAALAFALAMRLCEDDQERARAMLGDEWTALHTAGIVPQKPLKGGF